MLPIKLIYNGKIRFFMVCSGKELEVIELILKQWFSVHTFTKAAKIQTYPILDVENALIAHAVRSRQQEFSTGRWLARQGLLHFGLPVAPIEIGKLRNPLWPVSILGSITHDAEYCAVVLMQKQLHSEIGIGIDLVSLTHHTGKLEGLESMIARNSDEIVAVKTLNLALDPTLLLFSIKESVIKALSFYLDDFIDMRSIEISYANKLLFNLSGCSVKADIFAAKSKNYLLTAVKIYSN